MNRMFYRARAFNQNIGNWNVSGVTDMSSMFQYAAKFNQNIGNWDVSDVTRMSSMFQGATTFNQDISRWDVSDVTNIGNMFNGATEFNQDISRWDVSDVTNIGNMFNGATEFNQDISRWDVSDVTNIGNMFNGATEFNQDISRWDVSSVRHMNSMFQGATKFNQDISRWDVSPTNGGRTSVEMIGILGGATAFIQNLGLWYISHDLVDLAILPTVEAGDEVATFHGQNAFLTRGRSGRYVLSGEDSRSFTLTQPTISAQGALANAAVLTINEDPGVVGTEYRITISAVKHPATSRFPYGTNNHREFTFVVNNRPDITSHMMVSLKEIMLAENTQKVTDIAASDMDMDTLTYTLSTHDVALFEITDAGVLNFKTDYIPDYENPRNSRGKIDEEADQEYSVLVTVSDGVSTDKQKITVTIADANDAPTLADTTLQIAENSVDGASVGDIMGQDPDTTVPFNTLTYSIIDGDTDGAFAISDAGEITVNGDNKIDFETISSYELIVTVADGGTPALTDTATIMVNVTDVNEAPTLEDVTLQIAENSVDEMAVETITGEDQDTTAPNNVLTYSITDGNINEAFAISSSTGEITVNGDNKIDFETISSYELIVTVADGGTPALTDTATITVNVNDVNEAPTLADEIFELLENLVDGASVGDIMGQDPDIEAPNNELTYSITDGNTNEAFAISDAGEITVNGDNKIDFETISSYELIVTVADGGTPALTDTATITVNVNDVNEAPTLADEIFELLENLVDGASVGDIMGQDPDIEAPNNELTYSITDGNTNEAFAISDAGEITVNGDNKIDFETISSYELIVTVADGGTPALTDTATITVNVNDVNEAPTLADEIFELLENLVDGASVGDIMGQDPDIEAPNNELTYSITDGNTNEAFAISDAGEITVNGDNKIDFETISSYELIVTVADGGTPALTDTATITVNVNDVNEAPTLEDVTLQIAENSVDGASVGDIMGQDPDTTVPFNTLTYTNGPRI